MRVVTIVLDVPVVIHDPRSDIMRTGEDARKLYVMFLQRL